MLEDPTLLEERKLVGACGLYCGLCPRFQSRSKSRCEGCSSGSMGAYCAVYSCAVKHGYVTCADCLEYPCNRLKRTLKIDEELDSFVSHKPAPGNLTDIKKFGMVRFLTEQRERRLLAERLTRSYNTGRLMTFYCTACALLPTRVIRQGIDRVKAQISDGKIDRDDRAAAARGMRKAISDLARSLDVDLALRRKTRVKK